MYIPMWAVLTLLVVSYIWLLASSHAAIIPVERSGDLLSAEESKRYAIATIGLYASKGQSLQPNPALDRWLGSVGYALGRSSGVIARRLQKT